MLFRSCIPVDQGKDVILNWQTYLEKLEKNTRFEKTYSTIHYKTVEKRPTSTSYTRNDDKNIDQTLKWVSHSNQFFNTTLLADQSFEQGQLIVNNLDEEHENLKMLNSRLFLPSKIGRASCRERVE